MTPLEKLERICDEIFNRWDKDQRSGKLLTALAGHIKNYRADVDEVRAALAQTERKGGVSASDVDPTAGLNPDFDWGGDR